MLGRTLLISRAIPAFSIFVLLLAGTGAYADTGDDPSTDKTVDVSVYSNLYAGPKAMPFQLAPMGAYWVLHKGQHC
jgi:hypothetical protein